MSNDKAGSATFCTACLFVFVITLGLVPIGVAQDELPVTVVGVDTEGQPTFSWPGESGLLYGVAYSMNLAQWTMEPVSRIGEGVSIVVPFAELLTTPLPSTAFFRLGVSYQQNEDGNNEDMLTPGYYNASATDVFRNEVNRFVRYVRRESYHHPLKNSQGQMPEFSVPVNGRFGAGKGPGGTAQHHAATDLHISGAQTEVDLFAAHSGTVATFIDDTTKYRHYLSITKDVVTGAGEVIGKLVTIYAHLDLELDEASFLFMDGAQVEKGDLVSKHLYSGTVGGPHLHFEIRYYRVADTGVETFYGFIPSGGGGDFTEPGAGNWPYGGWDPEIGYGFAHPANHGLVLE